MKTKLQLVCFLALFASASAEPFKSGYPQTSSGGGVRIPANAGTTASPQSSNLGSVAKSGGAPKDKAPAADAAMVRQYAQNYYQSRQQGTVRVSVSVASLDPAQPIVGWAGRFRTTGTVRLTSSQNGKPQQETRSFEAITENGKVIDFTAK